MEEKEQELYKSPKQEESRQDLALLEAALYVAGRPLDLKTIGRLIGTRSKRKVKRLAKALIVEYRNRETALEILELEGERFVFQLKAEYTPRVRRLATRPLLSSGPLRTLSYIAYRQPVSQPQIIDIRGQHAYTHLKQLEDLDLITREKVGQKKMVFTTEFFADYFGLSHNLRTMKRQLKSIFEDFIKPESQEK